MLGTSINYYFELLWRSAHRDLKKISILLVIIYSLQIGSKGKRKHGSKG